jgi:glycosyltransferase involved in cell wall biosynthesis
MLIAIDGNEANVSQRVGVNQWAFELIKHLHQLKSEHQFVVFLKDRPLADMPPPTDNFRYEIFGPQKAWVLTGLTMRLLKKPRPDVLFSPSHYIPLVAPVKRIFAIVDLSYEKFGLEYFRGYDLQQLRRWTRGSAKAASKIITISQFSKQDIVDIYKVPEDKVAVIYPGYNSELYQPRIPLAKFTQVKQKYGIRGKYFLYVGTLQPRKNIARLIRAFAKLETKSSLVIVGKKGWLYEEILSLAAKLGISQRVIFTGFAPNEDLPALMKYSRAFVLPSLYEGFGIPVIEAQASGAITVVSRVSSLPEVAGESAIYINKPESVSSIRKALEQVLKLSVKKRRTLIEQGKENASRFSWKKAAAELVEALQTT